METFKTAFQIIVSLAFLYSSIENLRYSFKITKMQKEIDDLKAMTNQE